MSFVTGAEMREIEEAEFRRGVCAESLMEEAGAGIARHLMILHPSPGHVGAFIGKGNNGGDALVVLRRLRDAGWSVSVHPAYPRDQLGELPRRKWEELGETSLHVPPAPFPGPLVLLDGLLGIGASGDLRDPLRRLAAEMEGLRRTRGATIAAIDLPSGLHADTGEGEAVTADLTLTIGAPKAGLATAGGERHAGRIHLVEVAGLEGPDSGPIRFFCPALFPGLLPPRPHGWHKGDAGRVSVIAGSPGMTGAAVLCATAALEAGAGLVTLFVKKEIVGWITPQLPPEVMVRGSTDPLSEALRSRHDALVVGPGLGDMAPVPLEIPTHAPVVLDADALNALAKASLPGGLGPQHLLTPHPGEFARLAPDLAGLPRAEAASTFASRFSCTVLLKGSRTIVAAPGLPVRLNPTGHAGMASGGQGDVLAGVAGALLAAGILPPDAASLAAWLCGRAAERALDEGPFTRAGAVIRHLGAAFGDWMSCRR